MFLILKACWRAKRPHQAHPQVRTQMVHSTLPRTIYLRFFMYNFGSLSCGPLYSAADHFKSHNWWEDLI